MGIRFAQNVDCPLILNFHVAVWRHVLGSNDTVNELDIALGKCNIYISYCF